MIANQPNLLWVIRDAQEYKDDGVYFEDQFGKFAISKNEKIRKVRSSIAKGFNRRELIRVPHPTDGNTQLKRIEDLPTKSLSYEFRLKVEQISHKMMGGRAPVKTVNGKPINGYMLSKLIEKIVDILNSGKLPELSSV